MDTLQHTQHGRNPRSLIVLFVVSSGLIGLLAYGTHWGIVAALSLIMVPTLVDVAFNPIATFDLNEDGIRWKNATQEAELGFHQIKSVHIATRLNVAFRITVIMHDDAKVRIPQDVLPPRTDLEAALTRHEIPIKLDRLRLI
ncbi:hypothetical protein [Shimia sagamensis]|uniref:Uncharacterized protein n=1 Tax=Shimia sagamensis TaxID=1566352 RepID=A0ABY1P124_9RHOB|nr:hypothetical protein [Shimia sagamensis]SMP22347.1 hypothetical protein SAMN06265373_104167 [Shimia sagamensis]